ncbi:MAG: 2-oxo acid dehydrogenase subunit E2, partial [Candidatus Hermodarchaeia archaeon]
ADNLSIEEITAEAERLSNKMHEGKIDLEDVSGGTFTFSNFGMFGGDIATPLINPPQTAILALGRIIPKPVVIDEEIVVRKMGWISMTCDHRIINGVQAAMFSQSLTQLITNPSQIASN